MSNKDKQSAKKSAKELKRTKARISYLEFRSTKGGRAFVVTFYSLLGLLIAFAITVPFFLGGENKKVTGYTRDSASGTFEAFEKLAFETDDKTKDGYKYVTEEIGNERVVFTDHVQEVASNDQMIVAVNNNANGIGYVSSFTLEHTDDVYPVDFQDFGNIGTNNYKDLERQFNVVWEDPSYDYNAWLNDSPSTDEEWNRFVSYGFYYWMIDSFFSSEMIDTASYAASGEYITDGSSTLDTANVDILGSNTKTSRISGKDPATVDTEIRDAFTKADPNYKNREITITVAGSTSVKQVLSVLELTFVQLFGFQNLTFDSSQMQGSGYALTTPNAQIGFQSKTAKATEIVAMTGLPVSDYVEADAYMPFAIDSISLIVDANSHPECKPYDHDANPSTELLIPCFVTQEELLNVYFGESMDISEFLKIKA